MTQTAHRHKCTPRVALLTILFICVHVGRAQEPEVDLSAVKTADKMWLQSKPVVILQIAPPNGSATDKHAEIDALWQRRINTLAALMTTDQMLTKVDADEKVKALTWSKRFNSSKDAVAWLREHTEVRVIEGTSLIGVRVWSEDTREDSVMLSNRLAEMFYADQRKIEDDKAYDEQTLLTNMKVRNTMRLHEIDARLRKMIETQGANVWEDEVGRRLKEEADGYRKQLADVNLEMEKYSTRAGRIDLTPLRWIQRAE